MWKTEFIFSWCLNSSCCHERTAARELPAFQNHPEEQEKSGQNIYSQRLLRTTCDQCVETWKTQPHLNAPWSSKTEPTAENLKSCADIISHFTVSYGEYLSLSFLWCCCVLSLSARHKSGLWICGWTSSLRPADEDRLTRRKSFVDTISLQVDIMSNSLPDKVRHTHTHTLR